MKRTIILSCFLLIACNPEVFYLRKCVTNSGETFLYMQSNYEPMAEEMYRVVNRYGVRDTKGWWRDERFIYSCRNV